MFDVPTVSCIKGHLSIKKFLFDRARPAFNGGIKIVVRVTEVRAKTVAAGKLPANLYKCIAELRIMPET